MAFYTLMICYIGLICSIQEITGSLPIRIPLVVTGDTGSHGVCPSTFSNVLNESRSHIRSALRIKNEELNNLVGPPCSCGSSGSWTRIAHLNMKNSSEQCPLNWTLHTTPVRSCGRNVRTSPLCFPTIYSSNNIPYSKVCGRILAYQDGSPDAFENFIRGHQTNLNSAYIDGISVTHGPSNARHHIWSFVGSFYFEDSDYQAIWNCRCANTRYPWPYQTPPFIGNNYFCDSAYGTGGNSYDNPLWDGDGCPATSTCCELNNPPWFCTSLSQPTTDDIEVRLCLNQIRSNENIRISLIEIYVQ